MNDTSLLIIVCLSIGLLIYKQTGKSKLKYSIVVIIFLLSLFFGNTRVSAPEQTDQTTQPSPEATYVPADKQEALVTKIIDGDTIDVSLSGISERIRIIGIDSPETVDPRKSIQCFGQESSAYLKDRLTGKTVWLESDPSQNDRDKYRRLLRYVWVDNGLVDIGKEMIEMGYTFEYTYDIPYKYQLEYKQAQKNSEEQKKGLWADNACPTATPLPSIIPLTVPLE
jgi:micrococcal nuclease